MSTDRNALIRKIKLGVRRLGLDDDAYRDLLAKVTGKRSCGDMTDSQLSAVADHLKGEGAFVQDGRARGGKGPERPTSQQWNKLAALSRARGWAGLDDAQFQAFVRRTAKVQGSRFLTRHQASAVITGLEQWNRDEGLCR